MDFASARANMVENQIRANGVSDPEIATAMAAMPREAFLPRPLHGIAYLDEDIALGGGRYLVEPLVMARLLRAAAIRPTDVVLVMGDATGWGAAVVSRLASTVVSLESDGELSSRASAMLADLGCDNVAVVRGDLEVGCPAQAPYDAILYAGAVAEFPAPLPRQLADGGRLVAVVKPDAGTGRVVQLLRAGDTFGRRALFDAATPYLPGMAPKAVFRF